MAWVLADLVAAVKARAEALRHDLDLVASLGDPNVGGGYVGSGGSRRRRGSDWTTSNWLTVLLGGVVDVANAADALWNPVTQWLVDEPAIAVNNHSVGVADRIRTMGVVIPAPMSVNTIVVKASTNGGGTNKCSFGLYDTVGNLVLRTAAQDTTGWVAEAVRTMSVDGGPIAIRPGTYIAAWTADGTNVTFYGLPIRGASWASMDEFYAYTTTTSVNGELPDTIALSFTHDSGRGHPWFGLRD
jgi:hypothetical protein